MAPRLLDEGDNLPSAFKGIRDAIARRLGVDDNPHSKITWQYKQTPTKKGQYFVKIEIDSEYKPTALLLID